MAAGSPSLGLEPVQVARRTGCFLRGAPGVHPAEGQAAAHCLCHREEGRGAASLRRLNKAGYDLRGGCGNTMRAQQVAAGLGIILGVAQLTLASRIARINVRVAKYQGGVVEKIFGNPTSAPAICRIAGAVFVAIGIYGFFAV